MGTTGVDRRRLAVVDHVHSYIHFILFMMRGSDRCIRECEELCIASCCLVDTADMTVVSCLVHVGVKNGKWRQVKAVSKCAVNSPGLLKQSLLVASSVHATDNTRQDNVVLSLSVM